MSTSSDGGYTVMAWEFALNPGAHRPLDFHSGTSGCYVEEAMAPTGAMQTRICCQGQGAPLRCSQALGALPQQSWRHLALVASPTTQNTTLYVNGSFWGTLTNSANEAFWSNAAGDLRVGVGRPAYVDDVKLYNQAIPQQLICMLLGGGLDGLGCYGQGPMVEFHFDNNFAMTGNYWDSNPPTIGYEPAPGFGTGLFAQAISATQATHTHVTNLNKAWMPNVSYLFWSFWYRDTTTASNAILMDLLCSPQECQGNGGLYVVENGAGVRVCFMTSANASNCADLPAGVNTWHHIGLRTAGLGNGVTSDVEVWLDGKLATTLDVPTGGHLYDWLPWNTWLGYDPGQGSTGTAAIDEFEMYDAYVFPETICGLALGSWDGQNCNQ
jgi:hypothetical protein